MFEILQEIVGALLFFVLMFGMGFILNMLIKTTWFPMWLWIIVFIPIGVAYYWKPETTFWSFLAVWMPSILSSIAGAFVSGWAIRKLRKGGYKMF